MYTTSDALTNQLCSQTAITMSSDILGEPKDVLITRGENLFPDHMFDDKDYYKRYAEAYWEETRKRKEWLQLNPGGLLEDYLKSIENSVQEKINNDKIKLIKARQYYKDHYCNKYLKITWSDQNNPTIKRFYLLYISNPNEFDKVYRTDEFCHSSVTADFIQFNVSDSYGKDESSIVFSKNIIISWLPNPYMKDNGRNHEIIEELTKEEYDKYVNRANNLRQLIHITFE